VYLMLLCWDVVLLQKIAELGPRHSRRAVAIYPQCQRRLVVVPDALRNAQCASHIHTSRKERANAMPCRCRCACSVCR
jgi:hypothetical protein